MPIPAHIQTTVATLARRFPQANYGWAKVVLDGKVVRHSQFPSVIPNTTCQSFDCYSSSYEARLALEPHGLTTDVIHIQIPTSRGVPYQHYLTRLISGDKLFLVGFTYFEKLLGIENIRAFSRPEYDEFRGAFQARRERIDDERDCDQYVYGLSLQHYKREVFAPFSVQSISGTEVLTEVGYFEKGNDATATLRASTLGVRQASKTLERLGRISFIINFPNCRKIGPISERFESAIQGTRVCFDTDIADRNGGGTLYDSLYAAAQNDWPAFVRYVGLINEHLLA